MKKRILTVFAALLTCVLMTQVAFAAEALTVESIFPASDGTGLQTTNQMVRIVFNGEIDVDASQDCFKVVDSEGTAQDIMVLEQSDEPERVNLILKKDLKESEKYTVVVDASLTDKEGKTLGKEYTSSFTTRSMKKDSIITTLLMFVMFGAVIIFTLRDQKKKDEKAAETAAASKKKPDKVNPYKANKNGKGGKSGKGGMMANTKARAEEINRQRRKDKKQKVQDIMEKNKKKNGK